jgi:hypothetical protein
MPGLLCAPCGGNNLRKKPSWGIGRPWCTTTSPRGTLFETIRASQHATRLTHSIRSASRSGSKQPCAILGRMSKTGTRNHLRRLLALTSERYSHVHHAGSAAGVEGSLIQNAPRDQRRGDAGARRGVSHALQNRAASRAWSAAQRDSTDPGVRRVVVVSRIVSSSMAWRVCAIAARTTAK